jgi:uncharacterized SAM-binding protein YcdF (DUF218 family)
MEKSLSAEFLKAVGEYMLVETKLCRADACFLFGGEHADDLAAHAAKLYHLGYFGLIVCAGGLKTSKGNIEAHQMRDVLLRNGVPQDIILVEDKSTNTEENIRFIRALVEKTKGERNVKSAIAIGQIHGSRRFLMTLERRWPELEKMFTTPNYYPVSRADWDKDPRFREDVLREFNKIAPYKEHDFIREVDIAALNRKSENGPSPLPPKTP